MQTVPVIIDGADGAPGVSPVQAILSKESYTVSADASGTPTSLTGCATTMTIYQGTDDITSNYTFTKSHSSDITADLTGSTVTVNGITNGTGGIITITAEHNTTHATLIKYFSISVSKAGQAGTSAKVVNINPSSQVFKSTTGSAGPFSPEYIYIYPQ